jgi:uncharacterized RDD family membrane protein YckC
MRASADVADAADVARAPGALLPPGLVFADTPSRIVAYLLDGIVISIINWVPLAVLGFYDTTSLRPPGRDAFVLASLITFAISSAYFLWFWTGGRRATPGQRVFEIQVGNAFDGRSLTTFQAVERYLVMGLWLSLPALLPFLGVALVSFAVVAIWELVLIVSVVISRTKQGIHDRSARSAVVRPAGKGNGWAIGCLAAYGLVVGLSVAVIAAIVPLMTSVEYPPGVQNPFEYIVEYFRTIWPS